MSVIADLSPTVVWQFFDQITQIPRPSKHEGRIIDYLIDFAKSHNLDYSTDTVGNVVIYKPASAGMESAPKVILQSHVDMVCEKNSDVVFDFDKDPIVTRLVDGWVMAEGTTLGADCGIGMAAELAVLASTDLTHGAIEALFTVDEETGLTGAFGLGEEMISGKYLINLDSEDEGEIFIGCAGGIDTVATFKYKEEPTPKQYSFFRIDLRGLTGGHSGDDISKGRGNSNKLLNRFLLYCANEFELRLSYFDGGNLRNAIPREAFAVFGVPSKHVVEMNLYYESFIENIKREFSITEPSMELSISEMSYADMVIDLASQRGLLHAINGLSNGVVAMSQAIEGLVETSTNLASVKFKGNHNVVVTTSQRSSLESARDAVASSVASVLILGGASVEQSDGYPGWNPDLSSELLKVAESSYVELFGAEPKAKAIHAGLECGLFLEKYPWLDMISFGPTLRGVHSPDERLDVASVSKFWSLLTHLLSKLK